MNEPTFERIDFVAQAEPIEQILQQAVLRALSVHQRLGNSVAVWIGEGVSVVPPDEIDFYLDSDEEMVPPYFRDLVLYHVQTVS